MRHVECPCCGADITSSYETENGFGYWFCYVCDLLVDDDPQDDDYIETRRRDRD